MTIIGIAICVFGFWLGLEQRARRRASGGAS